ncbi:hypothetical protein FA95DRAFT_527203 [Auriscalpium vulgare]|uniref:Uncharacterized protein n=1 Tax=Auriscalpium vulgare TaxID=40419 RepID=A0ACB8S3U3_9AGAM|nr:hypothetical protein FA95DRAFT_527203 [Auriscalpium vulgare]
MFGLKRKSEDSQQAPRSPPPPSPTSGSPPASYPVSSLRQQQLPAGVIELNHKDFTVELPPIWIKAFKVKQRRSEIRNPGETFCARLWGKPNLTDSDYGFREDEAPLARKFLPFTGGRLLRRQEYDVMYQRAEDMYRYSPVGGVVVTGQPGIGKTASIAYIVARHLSERRIIAAFLTGSLFLFTEEGVFTHPEPSHANDDLDFGLESEDCPWLLVDMGINKGDRPPAGLVGSSNIFPLHLTSPDEERYKGWQTQREGMLLIMNPWTEEELSDGLALQSFFQKANPDEQEAYRNKLSVIIDQYGYVARDVYGALAGRKDLEIAIQNALNQFVSYEELKHLKIRMAQAHLNADAIAHQLVAVQRSNVTVASPSDSDRAVLKPKSTYIGALVSDWVRRAEHAQTKDVFRLLRDFPHSSTLAGWIFEGVVLQILARSPAVPADILAAIPVISPMERIHPNRAIFQHVPAPDSPDAPDELFEVLTVGDEPKDEELAGDEPMDVDAGVPQASLSLPELAGMSYYDNIREVPVNTKQLHVPSIPNIPLFDGLFIDHTATPKILWVCQVTIAKTHKGSAEGYAQVRAMKQKMERNYGAVEVKYLLVVTARPERTYKWILPRGWSGDVRGGVYCLRIPISGYYVSDT